MRILGNHESQQHQAIPEIYRPVLFTSVPIRSSTQTVHSSSSSRFLSGSMWWIVETVWIIKGERIEYDSCNKVSAPARHRPVLL
jgi:hypothetical protein